MSFDGQPTRTALDLTERLDRTLAKKAVRLEIVRRRDAGGEPQHKIVWVETADRPFVPTVAAAEPTASAPAAAPEHLHVPVGPTQAEELPLTLPKAVADRLERLERRLEQLERPRAAPSRVEAQASADRVRP